MLPLCNTPRASLLCLIQTGLSLATHNRPTLPRPCPHAPRPLQAEAARHAVAAAELSATAGSLEARQAALEARLARLAALHANMVERAGAHRAVDTTLSGCRPAADAYALVLCTAHWALFACSSNAPLRVAWSRQPAQARTWWPPSSDGQHALCVPYVLAVCSRQSWP